MRSLRDGGYGEPVYRPPSEAESLIVQISIGCAHNACTFCDMYKNKEFRVRSWEEFSAHTAWLKGFEPMPHRIFIADGDALAADTGFLLKAIDFLKMQFPSVTRFSAYAAPRDILGKSGDELVALRKAGLSLLYIGLESGDDETLKRVKKGATQAELSEAGIKAGRAGFARSVTLVSGLGGRERWREHAEGSARVVNAIDPEYLGLLTLMIRPGTELEGRYNDGGFVPLTPEEVAEETLLLLRNASVSSCIFRSNHASNYLELAGTLPEDGKALESALVSWLEGKAGARLRSEGMRRL